SIVKRSRWRTTTALHRYSRPRGCILERSVPSVSSACSASPRSSWDDVGAEERTGPTTGAAMVRGSTISKLISIVAGAYLLGAYAMAADGLTTMASTYGPKETMDRLEAEIKAKGLTVFARIDHAA